MLPTWIKRIILKLYLTIIMGRELRQCTYVAICVSLANLLCCETILQSADFSKPSVSNIALKNHLLLSLQRVRSASGCLANCLREPQCVAVSYSQLTGECELYDGSKTDHPSDVITNDGWSYYEITSKVIHKNLLIFNDNHWFVSNLVKVMGLWRMS